MQFGGNIYIDEVIVDIPLTISLSINVGSWVLTTYIGKALQRVYMPDGDLFFQDTLHLYIQSPIHYLCSTFAWALVNVHPCGRLAESMSWCGHFATLELPGCARGNM